ncbi:hypothetical protein [Candidatus Cyanaurora vandensis]|uniref:hypothetical protein n=1 Tax=Candidatus Cyanaurora vandensis TaxID=2714958 RepID=UPI00257FBCD6|nr:hypothetical protein [Candidatus Cyanaurora vandensis]
MNFTFLVDSGSADVEESFYRFFGINSGLTVMVFRAFTRFLAGELILPEEIGEMVSSEEIRKEMRERWEKVNSIVEV